MEVQEPSPGDVKPAPERVRKEPGHVDVKQVRREFARLTQLFETFPVPWQKRVHEYVQVYKETLGGAGVPRADTKRCAWEFQGALLQQLEAAELAEPGPSHAVDMGAWVARVLGSVGGRSPRPAAGARDAARAYVHARLLGWASTGVWAKRWSAEWLPSEDALANPQPSCAICLEAAKAPMRLSCGHEFCSRCVAKAVIAAFQGGRAAGCPFRCAEWLSKAEVEGLHPDAEDSLVSAQYSSSEAPSPLSGPASPLSAPDSWSTDLDYDTESAPDSRGSSASPPKELDLEGIRGHLAVTRALVQGPGDAHYGRLQHHVAALEVLLGVAPEAPAPAGDERAF